MCPKANIPEGRFDSLVNKASALEVEDCIRSMSGGTYPGPDGISVELLKMICVRDKRELLNTALSNCLRALVVVVNSSLSTGVVPQCLKHGWITMVPKSSSSSLSRDVANMRPITVLSELYKLTTRLLASRLGNLLLKFPDSINMAQRGFLRDGSTAQCIDVLADVIEDFKSRKERSKKLFLISYDQAKAYDSVQWYVVKAALARLRMPPRFIDFVLSGLEGARSQVRTRDGLTEPFDLRSSVRQGDPLAPLVYLAVMDILHDGLKCNPLHGGVNDGYIFANDKSVCVPSRGYADDTVVATQNEKGASRMHEWVREFFGACCGKLNCNKSVYSYSGPPSCHPAPLLSVDGESSVSASKDATFKYLGARINAKLCWKDQITAASRIVFRVSSSIAGSKFGLIQSKYAVEQVLFPWLWHGLQVAKVPIYRFDRWDKMIRRAVLKAAGCTTSRHHISVHGFYALSGIPSIRDLFVQKRACELMVRLNSTAQHGNSCWSRIAQGLGEEVPRVSGRGLLMSKLHSDVALKRPGVLRTFPGNRALSMACSMIEKLDFGFAAPPHPEEPPYAREATTVPSPSLWNPYACPYVTYTPEPSREVLVFTDGSTPVGHEAKQKNPLSGVAAVFPADNTTPHPLTIAFPFACSGNNFLAEVFAIVAAVVFTPAQHRLVVYTDSLAALLAIDYGRDIDWLASHAQDMPYRLNSYTLTERKRILSAARPALSTLRRLISVRTGRFLMRHVKAHTGAKSFEATHNDNWRTRLPMLPEMAQQDHTSPRTNEGRRQLFCSPSTAR